MGTSWNYENVSEFNRSGHTFYTFVKHITQRTVLSKWMYFIACKLYFTKLIKQKAAREKICTAHITKDYSTTYINFGNKAIRKHPSSGDRD